LMAEVKTYGEKAKVGSGKIHLGATSMDIEDNADTIRIIDSLAHIEKQLNDLLSSFGVKIEKYKDMACMGYTHLQTAEPTTVGYRFAFYAQDLLYDKKLLDFVKLQVKGKGMKGAVGTAASYTKLLDEKRAVQLEKNIMEDLGIDAVTVASQTAPRKIEFLVANTLSSIATSLHKFAFDLRIMQSPGFGEWQEPFGKKQIGSSAMPFKRNPWKAEQICSLARIVFNLANVARDNSANMLLERTLDDSASRRVFLPEIFLAIDEMLQSSINLVEGLVINEKQIVRNLDIYGPFAATEVLLMESVKRGADRQEMHEVLRENALKAYEVIQDGGSNPLEKQLMEDRRITKFIPGDEVKKLLDPKSHVGRAPQMCETFLKELKDAVSP
jgi:adenylosuccinate lyase